MADPESHSFDPLSVPEPMLETTVARMVRFPQQPAPMSYKEWAALRDDQQKAQKEILSPSVQAAIYATVLRFLDHIGVQASASDSRRWIGGQQLYQAYVAFLEKTKPPFYGAYRQAIDLPQSRQVFNAAVQTFYPTAKRTTRNRRKAWAGIECDGPLCSESRLPGGQRGKTYRKRYSLRKDEQQSWRRLGWDAGYHNGKGDGFRNAITMLKEAGPEHEASALFLSSLPPLPPLPPLPSEPAPSENASPIADAEPVEPYGIQAFLDKKPKPQDSGLTKPS